MEPKSRYRHNGINDNEKISHWQKNENSDTNVQYADDFKISLQTLMDFQVKVKKSQINHEDEEGKISV